MIEITNEDNMLLMARYPDNYFDLAIVDPPYGIGDVNQTASKKCHKKIQWNNYIPSDEYFSELYRVSKNQIIWGSNYYQNKIKSVGRIIHNKDPKDIQLKELSSADIASHSFGVNVKIFTFEWRGNVQGNTINWKNEGKNARIHPTQKPVELYEWIFAKYAKENDKILDTHLGSGSIAIAIDNVNKIEKMNLTLTACELDTDYFNAAIKRIEQQTAQQTIF